jgi:oligopeptide transport system permease protein
MKGYILGRLLRSFISIFLVTTLTYMMIFSLVPRRSVFSTDPIYSKMTKTQDMRVDYEDNVFNQMGYIDYLDSKALQNKAEQVDKSVSVAVNKKNKNIYNKWAKLQRGRWEIKQFPISKRFYATREIPLLERVVRFYSRLIQIDHPWRIHDKDNPDLKRGYKISNDKAYGFALVGSGTKYKYQVYFDKHFPFIHQNIVHLYLGESYPSFSGREIMDVIANGQGQTVTNEITFPTGKKQISPVNIHTAQYQLSKADSITKAKFGKDPYSKTDNFYQDPSMLSISSKMGFISLVIVYVLGVPLAALMARFKSSWIDKLGTGAITLLISIPSLAIIYFFRFVGSSLFGWPDLFSTLGAQNVYSYILPIIILAMINITNIVMWTRRYMIDQQSADYVKFARAKGLSEREISQNHILKNAIIPIVQGMPSMIILMIQGATMTESIFVIPGMGKMLPDAIIGHNNSMVVGLVFLFTLLAVVGVFIGDLLMIMIDPRINLRVKGGK